MANDKVDVVIVGAGASGSVFAAILAKASKKVVLLEAGPDWQLDDLISSDIWGRRIKPAGPLAQSGTLGGREQRSWLLAKIWPPRDVRRVVASSVAADFSLR